MSAPETQDGHPEPKTLPESRADSTHHRPESRLEKLASRLMHHVKTALIEVVALGIVLLILTGVVVLEHHPIYELWQQLMGSHDIKVVIAVFPIDSTADPIKKGLGLAKDNEIDLIKGSVKLRFVPERETLRGTEAAVRKAIKDPNVVLVIGHYSSSTAERMLGDVYEEDPTHPVPVILPAVTNPEITRDPPNDIHHVLRLPASDTVQVNELITLLNQLTANANNGQVLLIVDKTNPTYSGYIARELLKQRPQLFVDSIGVALDGEGFRPERYKDSQPDVIVFVGMENQGMLFLKLIAESHWATVRKPVLVFTDGVAGNAFMPVAEEVAAKNFRIFITAPIPTRLSKGKSVGDNFPNYEDMGTASRKLAELLLNKAKDSYGEINRQTVLNAIQDIENSKKDLGSNGLALNLEFDENGDDSSGGVHVYEIKDRRAIHSCDCTSYADSDDNSKCSGIALLPLHRHH
jgi:hypothetical protein